MVFMIIETHLFWMTQRKINFLWHGKARHGKGIQGKERQGKARQEKTMQGNAKHGMARQGMAWKLKERNGM
jgi:hypothetical protein